MNDITLVRFIDAMRRNQYDAANQLYIDLMVEEVEGFLEYPRLVTYFEQHTPLAYTRLCEALENQATLTRTTSPFKALVAINPTGTVAIPQHVIFFYIEGDSIKMDRVEWISEEPRIDTWTVGAVVDGWVEGVHLSYPYEEIKSPYLHAVYLDKVVPGKSAYLTKLLCVLTAMLLDEECAQTWSAASAVDSYWEHMGYRKYQPK